MKIQNGLTHDPAKGGPRVQVNYTGLNRNFWLELPKEIQLLLEVKYLDIKSRALVRTLSRGLMDKWWDLAGNKLEYFDWSVCMLMRMIDEVKRIHDEWEEEERHYKEEKQMKRKQQEDEREARVQPALQEYLRDHGLVLGFGIKSIACKWNIYQNQLREAINQYNE